MLIIRAVGKMDFIYLLNIVDTNVQFVKKKKK